MAVNTVKELSANQQKELLQTLEARFRNNVERHKGIEWKEVAKRLEADNKKLLSLYLMEEKGGEPDVVSFNKTSGEINFIDCAAESPKGRRSVCYDREALESRKKFKPENSAMTMAADMGIELLSEEEYKELQQLGNFDRKTSSWLLTPNEIRERGGAIFGDRRFGRVFIYHNGAESYYAARGFRGKLTL